MASLPTGRPPGLYTALFGHVDEQRPCILEPDGTVITYGELAGRSASLAGVLRAEGVEPGDRVVVQIDKSVDAVALYLACLRSGAVHVPLNTAYTPAEVAGFVEDAAPTVVVLRPDAPPPGEAPGCVVHTLGAGGEGTLATATAVTDPWEAVAGRSGDDWAAMLYTSGTTGRSKGAMLSCTDLVANAQALTEAWHFASDDVVVHVLPVFHVHGLFVALHCAWAVGASTRFHHRFDPDAVVDDLGRSTVLMGVPTHYHRLLASSRLTADAVAGMRLFTSGSAPLPAREHQEFGRRTGHRIVERYGMTETMILTTNPYDGSRVPGTVGFPLPGVSLRVVDDDGSTAPPDETGAVEVTTPGAFLGYWRRNDATAAATTEDGWFRTGDLGSLDPEGRLSLVGRASDLIISGGLNIYPKEIEQVLDDVDGVVESAVIGLPDPDFGEEVVAVLVVDGDGPTDQQLTAACGTRLARFKHPRRYRRVEALPRNAMGKVQKASLRADPTWAGGAEQNGR